MEQPWDVPRTEEGRDRLIALTEQYKAAGAVREAGICLSRLAHAVKWVGTADGANAFRKSAELAAEAVELLRKTDDKSELCRALRYAAVPFVADCEMLLAEAQELAQEIGDIEQEAWVTFQMRGFGGGPDPNTERALELFRQCGSLEGQAHCYRTLGFKIGQHNPEWLQKSIDLFEQAGNSEEAERGRKFLEVALMPDDPNDPEITDQQLKAFGRMFVAGCCDDRDDDGDTT